MNDDEFKDFEKPQVMTQKSTSTGMIIALVVAVAVAAFFIGSYFSNINSDSITNSDLENALSRIESKLENNPPTPTQRESPQPNQPIIVSLDDDPLKGNPDAEISIVEFSDFQCPFCARFHTNTLPQLEKNYISTGKVNFVYRDFPIESIHPNAIPAALASECADDQGKFWEYHDLLFQNQRSWQGLSIPDGIETFKGYAENLGLEMEEFNSCLDSRKYTQEVSGDLQDGRNYGVTGTPGFFVGNEKIGFTKITGAQPYSVFETLIENQLR